MMGAAAHATTETGMDVAGKVVVVTGGASGIGLAMCRAFAAAGARGVVVADLDAATCDRVAMELGPVGLGCATNVADAAQVQALVDRSTERFGQVDVFCSNAGVISRTDQDTPMADWQRHWDVNLMAHVHAANSVLPQMLARGEGYLVQTVSAAGLLSQVNAAPYTVTKHAAAGFAEWLSIAYGDAGIRVSCLCPQGVMTPLMLGADAKTGRPSFLKEGALSPDVVAQAVLAAMRQEHFLVLPHPEVLNFWQRKTADIDRWLAGMRRLRAKVMASGA